jgi:hypothetical protein
MADQIGAIIPKPEELVQYYSSSKGKTQEFLNRFFGTVYAMRAMMRFSMVLVGCPVTVAVEQPDPEFLQTRVNGVHVILFPSDKEQTLRIEAYGDGHVRATIFRPATANEPQASMNRLIMPIRRGDTLHWHFSAGLPHLPTAARNAGE